MPNELDAITSQLTHVAYLTDHGQLLCEVCTDHNKAQLGRAGIALTLVPCHGEVLCTLCDRTMNA